MGEIKFNRAEIIAALKEKRAKQPCHRCGNDQFTLIDGFSRLQLYDEIGIYKKTDQGVPVILVGCENCGAITAHAAYALISKNSKDETTNGK